PRFTASSSACRPADTGLVVAASAAPAAGTTAPAGAAEAATVDEPGLYAAPSRCDFLICASTATIAVMLTTRLGVLAGVRTWAGWSVPIRIGPMATPSVITRIRL